MIARARATSTTKTGNSKRGRTKVTDEPKDKPELIEDENGNPVSTSTAAIIRERMRQHWQTLHNKGRLPPNFSAADSEVLAWFRNQMYREFPFLMLCEYNWKLDRLWKETFPGWRPSNIRAAQAEPTVEPADATSDVEEVPTSETTPTIVINDSVLNSNQTSTNGIKRKQPPVSAGKPQADRLKRSKKAAKETDGNTGKSSFSTCCGCLFHIMQYRSASNHRRRQGIRPIQRRQRHDEWSRCDGLGSSN